MNAAAKPKGCDEAQGREFGGSVMAERSVADIVRPRQKITQRLAGLSLIMAALFVRRGVGPHRRLNSGPDVSPNS
jgi:hypothetical protein